MTGSGWKAFIRRDWGFREPELMLVQTQPNGDTYCVQPIAFDPKPIQKHAPCNEREYPPTFGYGSPSLGGQDTRAIIQAIVDAAHEAGFRPSGNTPAQNEIKRLEDHLADMRRIVFEEPRMQNTVRKTEARD